MAHLITDYTRFLAAHGAFTQGDLQDDPGGTLVDRVMMNDIVQLQQALMLLAGVTPNGGDDGPAFSNSQLLQSLKINVDSNFGQAADATHSGAWRSYGAVTATTTGGGTFSGGTYAYNKYKILGNTLYWTIQFKTGTIAGTVTGIIIPAPPPLIGTGGTWENEGGRIIGDVNFSGSPVAGTNPLIIGLTTSGGGDPQITLSYNSVNFPTTGNFNFDLHIVTEI